MPFLARSGSAAVDLAHPVRGRGISGKLQGVSRLYGWFQAYGLVLAAVGVIALVAALASGVGARSLAFLAAALFWLAVARYWGHRAAAAKRHRGLRARRLERERAGLAPRRN